MKQLNWMSDMLNVIHNDIIPGMKWIFFTMLIMMSLLVAGILAIFIESFTFVNEYVLKFGQYLLDSRDKFK